VFCEVSGRASNPALGAFLKRVAKHALVAEGFHAGTLSVAVVGARAMSALHRRFLKKPGPTDVLSFDLGTDRKRGLIDAQVVICADVARRVVQPGTAKQAGSAKFRFALRAELALYLVHGILHLAGYDDHDPTHFARMHAREDDLLTRCRVGPVFRTTADPAAAAAARRRRSALQRERANR
jgi:probable rRNA maturation factor